MFRKKSGLSLSGGQQQRLCIARTGPPFFTLGEDRAGHLVEVGDTLQIFTNPRQQLTENYVSGRFG